MHIFLTGGTGFVGSAVLRRLTAADHQVTALVRSDDAAAKVTAAGATALIGDITDIAWLTPKIAVTDGAVHTASPGDATSQAVDSAVATAATAAFAGTGKPYVHTGGIWVYGNGAVITEETPLDPPALTAWRPEVERIALGAEGVRGVVVVPAVVYGHGGGIPNVISGAERTESGAPFLIGDGTQHWTTVHVDDLADLYVRALEDSRADGHYIGSDGRNPTVRELGEAASRASGGGGSVRPATAQDARARLGELFADALLLSQQAAATRARTELGWKPSRPSLVEELETGSYAPKK
ncbi:NAD-dependent epimerase/dehydratase family protein [Streptomyces sp. NPDC051569]|uniref:NAD-dependent epimerase/dehydratase family protein n=1 Tax=Streptomyces sp. NPDC051569 TaxID=3365661 RepID=UPI00378C23AA